ncbi:Hypothetical protein [Pseudomonas phage vB_PaeP_Tr60_Ab31]|uniref:Hypothetical protein n=1 Tax=Pseudomonas phage vB_PaeP_Tr60_Ab31 TaxID=1449437 RepID=UPI0003EFC9B3|nr:hypothetical protein [Pseudomonas aeruginosa]YP_009007108.1 Hypothetical protein CF86_gp41 [Pseudomonas phage vB_PaeP_Tr60_Ab31]MBO8355401.1 hypothetical protein [Pseudomonas aeruginosa]MBO8413656.1 hypothetical protein [Pseudomonas aeruginosa]MCT5772499.1 hypothetical protein [Pseudomonas aeruginosa]CDL74582.1 Hypothetical protein [Pseudomonas phage vB_PaeP_Tr60_Ab31]
MKERPILFNDQMVRAILEGRKTVTRRIAKPVKHPDLGNIYAPGALVLEHEPQHVVDRACPYGQPGDRLWVREAWQGPLISDEEQAANQSWWKDMTKFQDQAHCAYRASGDNNEYVDPDGYFHCKWKPSIHMPRWASRILLEIVSVRVERLQDGEGETAFESRYLAEGMNRIHHGDGAHYYSAFRDETHPSNWCDPFDAWRELWESINGADSWAANPWVWVVEFKRVTP